MDNWINPLPNVPPVESPFFEQIFTQDKFSEETLRIGKSLYEDGYAIFDFNEPDFDNLIDNLHRELYDHYNWEKINNGFNERIQDAWRMSNAVQKFASNKVIMELLKNLYGRKPIPFQTMNFPNGTEQAIHADSVHFHSIPERYMCAVWVAFEDITMDSGPLFYLPKSHKLPIYKNEQIGKFPDVDNPYKNYDCYSQIWEKLVEVYDLKTEYFLAKKGQALIWSTNLLHGGSFQKDKTKSRHSQVTHYLFEDCTYYTPLWSLDCLGIMHHRDIVDISTGEQIPNQINGVLLDREFLDFVSLHGDRRKFLSGDRQK